MVTTNSTLDNRSAQRTNLSDMKTPLKPRQWITRFGEAYKHIVILLKHLTLQETILKASHPGNSMLITKIYSLPEINCPHKLSLSDYGLPTWICRLRQEAMVSNDTFVHSWIHRPLLIPHMFMYLTNAFRTLDNG